MDNLIQIGHNCEIGENTVMAAQVGIAGTTKVEKKLCFWRAGRHFGAYYHWTRVQDRAAIGNHVSVAPGSTILGSPAMDIKLALKSAAIVRNLPELRNEVIQLEKRLKDLEEKNK